jgi:hypothetical protein
MEPISSLEKFKYNSYLYNALKKFSIFNDYEINQINDKFANLIEYLHCSQDWYKNNKLWENCAQHKLLQYVLSTYEENADEFVQLNLKEDAKKIAEFNNKIIQIIKKITTSPDYSLSITAESSSSDSSSPSSSSSSSFN